MNFTFSDGHRPIRVEPAIVSWNPVSRSTRAWTAEVRKPEGIPTISSTVTAMMTAATAAPAIFRALMTTFQTRQAATYQAVADYPSLSRKPDWPKAAKNNLELSPRYVTYDTVRGCELVNGLF